MSEYLYLNAAIYCPECHERFYVGQARGKTSITHPVKTLNKDRCSRTGESPIFHETTYVIPRKEAGKAYVQIPEGFQCKDCGIYYQNMEFDSVRIIFHHPMASYTFNAGIKTPIEPLCKSRLTLPLAQFTIFI